MNKKLAQRLKTTIEAIQLHLMRLDDNIQAFDASKEYRRVQHECKELCALLDSVEDSQPQPPIPAA